MIASDIMTRNVHTIHPGASAQEAARLLSQEHMSGAPVVDAHGKVIGIVSRAAIVNAVAQGHLVIRPWEGTDSDLEGESPGYEYQPWF